MADFCNPRNKDVISKVVELYLAGSMPLEIQKELNFKHFQPIYNILKKANVYERRETRYSRKYFFNENYFSVIDTESKAYFLGFIAADGSVDKDESRVKIRLQARDTDILEKLLKEVEANFEVKQMMHDGFPQCAVDLNSKILKQDLIDKGILPNKSLTMSADVMRFVPDNLVRHFLRGFFDGDGNVFLGGVYSSGTKYSVSVIGTEQFLKESFLKHCKSNSPLAKYKSCDMWNWRASSTEHVFGFLKYIYEDASIYLDRKYNYVKDYVLSECAHVKSGELLEIFTPKTANDNQQPSATSISCEGSETIPSGSTL